MSTAGRDCSSSYARNNLKEASQRILSYDSRFLWFFFTRHPREIKGVCRKVKIVYPCGIRMKICPTFEVLISFPTNCRSWRYRRRSMQYIVTLANRTMVLRLVFCIKLYLRAKALFCLWIKSAQEIIKAHLVYSCFLCNTPVNTCFVVSESRCVYG